MRRPLIVANWKMHHTVAEGLAYVTILTHELKTIGNVDVAIAPPFTSLYSLSVALSETPLYLAAQNLFWEEHGAYTGEISGSFLKDVGCRFVIVGHSERRRLFGETNAMVGKKVSAAVRDELIPILCVGETLEERQGHETWNIIEAQLQAGFSDLRLATLEECVIAYEPVWAIGTGHATTPKEAEEVHGMIREWLSKKGGSEVAERTRIIYGGSVKPDNAASLLTCNHIDGALVGGASLDAKQFASIIRSAT